MNLIRFLIFLIFGYLIESTISDILRGLLILIFGIIILVFSFYKKIGWFKNKQNKTDLTLTIIFFIIGFTTAYLTKIQPNYNYLIFATFGIFIILYFSFVEGYKYWKLTSIKKRFYNHPAFLIILIILITIIIAILFGK